MEKTDLLKKLKGFRRKWRREDTREINFRSGKTIGYVPSPLSLEKSVGLSIGYCVCAREIEKLIRQLEKENS